MQGFIETQASSFSRCNCIVLLQLFGILRFFCDIKSDKNHQLQSKSHRNNNDKNSICKRIIIWYKFLLCCGNTVLHMFQSEWHYDKFIVSKLFVKIIFENDLKNTNPWQFLFVGIVLTFMIIVCLLLLILFYVYVLLIDIIEKITTIKVLRVRTVWFLKLSAKRRLYNVDNFTHL